MKIFIASDHAAFEEKNQVVESLNKEFEVEDFGPTNSERCNYPDYATKVAKAVANEEGSYGVLLCGSGIGVSIVANKYQGIRAALVRTQEEAKLARGHNNANIICLGARINSIQEIKEMTKTFLSSPFEGGRHEERVALFSQLGESTK